MSASLEIVVKSQIMRVMRYIEGIIENRGESSTFKMGEIAYAMRYIINNKLKALKTSICQGSAEKPVLNINVSEIITSANIMEKTEVKILFFGGFSGLLKLRFAKRPTNNAQSKIKHKNALPYPSVCG